MKIPGINLPRNTSIEMSTKQFLIAYIQNIYCPFTKREKTMHKKLVALLCVGVMITIAGCGASNPPTTPVTGTVTYDGEPLEGATITMTPEAGSTGSRSASGISDASGNFTITTVFPDGQSVDGALGGSYTVRVSKLEADEQPANDGMVDEAEGDPSAAYMDMVNMMSEDGEDPGPESLINEVFSSYEKQDNWKNQVSVAEPTADGGGASTLTITLDDNGSGEAKIQ